MPRHLSQHVGGFVISDAPLSELVPVENAAMPERTIIQWDKDDLDTMRLLKVDCLALGMLSCVRRCLDLLRAHRGQDLQPGDAAGGRPGNLRMIQRADTVGVFQIESRAQMAMLPRHRPANFYDLVIEVAIVRPGPIQGDMVHPYLRRRQRRGAGGLSVRGSESGVRTHARRAAVPGTGDAAGDRGGRLHARAKPTSCAARWRRGNATAAWNTIASGSCAA